MNILRDQIWQFIGAILTLAAIFVAIYIFYRERRRKSVSYQVSFFDPILTHQAEHEGNLRISYKGKRVSDLFLIALQITNSGDLPITTPDYEKPLSFLFGEDAVVYAAEVTRTQPSTLHIDLAAKPNRVTLSPALLNAGDLVELKILVSSPVQQKIHCDGRIVGVREIVEKRPNPLRYMGWAFIGILLLSASLVYAMALLPLSPIRITSTNWLFYVLGASGSALGIGGVIMYIWNTRGRPRSFIYFVARSLKAAFSRDT